MGFTQSERLFQLNTPLGEDVLLLKGITGEEGISKPYFFNLDMLSSNHNISFKDIVGKNVTVSVALADRKTRYINGIVAEFAQTRSGEYGETGIVLSSYAARVVPWLWLLTRTTDSRIFQNMTVPEIVEKIFREKQFGDFKLNLKAAYEKKEYCVQYRETDFNFISRLLEDEGIYYFFQHENGRHILVLADDPGEHKLCPDQKSARCRQHAGLTYYGEDVIENLQVKQEIRAGKYSLSDFNFETPNASLKAEEPSNQMIGPGEREYYDYPGGYAKKSDGDRLVKLRMQAEEVKITMFYGESNCRAFMSGYKFKVEDFYRKDMDGKEYVLTGIRHEGSQSYEISEAKAEQAYKNEFSCIPVDVPYRPSRRARRPVVEGVQTAMVVGPKGEEIYPDSYGRVKVQFHWDREGKKDENSSCWIRVSQNAAGAGWGAIDIPRIGHEVIVDFEEGDPDRPIITGRVYHALNKPPYALPDEKTKSAIKTNSSPGGEGFNELRFEDKKDEEQVFIHAQKDMDLRVKKDLREVIENDRNLTVKRDSFETVEFDRHINVVRDEMTTVGRDRHLKVAGKEATEIAESRSLVVSGDSIEVLRKGGSLEAGGNYYIKGMNVVIEGMTGLTIKVGGSFVTLNAGGIFLSGPLVNINSGGAALAGMAGSPVAPVVAGIAALAANALPGEDRHKTDSEKKSWIEIELVDDDGKPAPGEEYRVTLPDNTVTSGTLDEKGYAKITGIDPGNCKVTFPNLDKEAWEKA